MSRSNTAPQKKNNYFALLIILIPVMLAAFFFMRKSSEGALIDKGNRIAVAVDNYKDANGKPPRSLAELHLSADTTPFHYETLRNNSYKISFTAKDGKIYVFDAERKEWE
jgi:hypothetical protein